ncbi:MAG: FHA domain-containing protein [Chitinophagaceae bacterium]|nr:FHA domain-containing protein [Chitinophagaceae bacterium]
MKSAIKIGRDNSNDVIINEPGISRNHAIVTDLGNGSYEVKDLGSSNGTFVNRQRITLHIIQPGDELMVGSSRVDWQAAFQSSLSKKTDTIIQEDPFSKTRKTIMVGSSDDNDIVIDNSFVSAHHAKVSVLKNGNYFLQDMGSSNGSFVNGARVITKNFSKTDVVKIAGSDLPNDWFKHKKLRINFLKDHKKAVWTSFSMILLLTAGTIGYINRCSWFGWDCNLSAEQVYQKNKNTLVYIEHEYYYTILFNGTRYYVGKNKNFTDQTEANPDKKYLLAYSRTSGSGCFIKPDGSILTSSLIINPWLNETERSKMISEVIASKTIKGLNNGNSSQAVLCGETAVLKWLPNGAVNNQQNFIEASAIAVCMFTDTTSVVIQSVKKGLPLNTAVADISFSNKPGKNMHNTEEKYYSYFSFPKNGEIMKDSFYARKDSFDINKFPAMPILDSLPGIQEGSTVFNSRGELIGLVQKQQVSLLPKFINQIKN